MSTRVVHDEGRTPRRAGEDRGERVRDAAGRAGEDDVGRIGGAHARGGVRTEARRRERVSTLAARDERRMTRNGRRATRDRALRWV